MTIARPQCMHTKVGCLMPASSLSCGAGIGAHNSWRATARLAVRLPLANSPCKANPAQSNCGNAGAGSFPHFMALLLARETGISLNHVPYRGGSAAMLALTGGQVSAALATEGSALALEHSAKVRVLATTATRRSIFFPKAPSFNELGYRHLAQREWFGAFMPRQAPAVAVASVADEISAMLAEADVRDLWGRMGLIPTGSSPAELKTTLRQEHDFWAPIIKASGFTPEA
jgi:tripartite-type tricarboxylate transporter receptor subunit TctC